MERLMQITAPHFVAGAVWEGGICKDVAPIIHWMRGKTLQEVEKYLNKKKWRWTWVGEDTKE